MKSFVAIALTWASGYLAGADPTGTTSAASGLNVQVGPRPYYLIEQMAPSALKTQLQDCSDGPFVVSDFSISHRGAPLQFPEHTVEGYQAAARMGAGIIECDVTFTADGELVCRHAQCDLHATTDIVARDDLRQKCSVPPRFAPNGELTNAADVTCCATDLTLADFRSLCGTMEGANPNARSVAAYLQATTSFRTDLYSTCGTLISHAESISLFGRLGVKFTPELKGVHVDASGNPALPKSGFGTSGLDQQSYASRLIAEYQAAKVKPEDVFVQSFDLRDLRHWLASHPDFGRQAVYLIQTPGAPSPAELYQQGVRILGVPIGMLLDLPEQKHEQHAFVASDYAIQARAAGLELIAWSAERSGRMREEVKRYDGAFYYDSIHPGISDDGAVMAILHALNSQVGVRGVFSDWPGTTSYYASCLGR